MLIRIFFIGCIILAIAYFVFKRRNIRIGLTPLGRVALLGILRQVVRLILRRFGL